ncbi:LytR C-terminal domain-containing protein [Corynebacterium comes]|uniref:LytR/CpsA/Psr regulator C-terminal domain-containing protein n=1 Tax=Corynebacterium comes TaxID=2675218 RepID=A0A6B8VNH9_9CORY|nr:LytR C-terminal domain-containing protein [Corynebacterium comes]QGU05593.1 hypothetical protein CETAM_11805 [Corynebacterium comes]
MTNVNPENKPDATDSGSPAGSGLPLRGLAMVLIAVAVLLAMWGLYATTQNSDSSDTAAPVTTQVDTATETATPEQTPEESTVPAEETRPEETREEEERKESETGTTARAAAQPAPSGGAPAPEPERVHVLNNSTVPNLAADVADTLNRDGYDLGEVGNLADLVLPQTTVFFQPGNPEAEQRARELADRVGGVARGYDESLPDGTEGRNDLTLVLVEQVAF